MVRLVSLYLVLLLHVLDTSVANLALVTIARDLRIETFDGQWVVTSFGVGLGVAIAMAGRLTAWAGVRAVLTLALVGSAVFSLGCGFAGGFAAMVAMRTGHGIASGLVIILGQKMLVELAGPGRQAFGLSLWSSAMSIAPVLGPVAGAAVIEHFSWRWVFWLNVPLLALALLALRRDLALAPDRRGTPPPLGPPLLLGALLISLQFVLDIAFAPASGSTSGLLLALAGVVAGAAGLALHARTTGAHVFEWRVLGNVHFLAFTAVAVVVNGLLIATTVSFPVWLQLDCGLPLRLVAQVVAAGGVIAGVLSPLFGRIKSRRFFPWMVVSALWLLCASFWLTAQLEPQASLTQLVIPRLLLGVALALFSPAAYLAIARLPEADFIAANSLAMFLRAALGNVIVAVSAGMMRRLDVTYAERFVASGGAGWFHLDVRVDLGAVASAAASAAQTRSMQAFFAVAAALCLLLSLSVSIVRGYFTSER